MSNEMEGAFEEVLSESGLCGECFAQAWRRLLAARLDDRITEQDCRLEFTLLCGGDWRKARQLDRALVERVRARA
jgi:hypothetical protein